MAAVLPPATIGILGGGQLGRMTALAARSLGYGVHVLDPDSACAARPVVDRVVVAPFDDVAGAAELARHCDVVTIEIEQIAPEALAAAMAHAPVRPGAELLRIVQHRGRQKQWLADQGFPVGPWVHVESDTDLLAACDSLGVPLFLKACEGGFDGRSQVRVTRRDDASWSFDAIGGRSAIAEAGLDLALELSVLVARGTDGECVVYPPAVNEHERQVLAWSVLPGALPPGIAGEATVIAREIAESIGLEGILAVEMFLTFDGRLLVNELAPRPHNSYHASELACPTSQFEQLVRAVCGLPLGAVEPVRPSAIANLFGDLWMDGRVPNLEDALRIPGVRLFLYGKHGARAGRKMGHLAASGETAQAALQSVRDAFARL